MFFNTCRCLRICNYCEVTVMYHFQVHGPIQSTVKPRAILYAG